jgi:hypothetical protein
MKELGLRARPAASVNQNREPGVYFLWSTTTKLMKIGCSKNVADRIKEIRMISPDQLLLVGVIQSEGYLAIEKSLHRIFADKRVNGEWFRLDEMLLPSITVLCDVLSGNVANQKYNTLNSHVEQSADNRAL